MSKCLKCGAPLPPVGECPTCAAATQPAARAIPSLLDKEIQIDRRRPDREAPAPAPSAPPGMMARAPVPPGMNPANPQGPRPQAPAPAAPRAPGLPVMPPRPQAPAAQMAPAPAPRPQAPAAPAAPRAQAPAQAAAPRPSAPPQATPSFNLPGVAAPAPRPSAPQPVVESAAAPAPAPRQASAPGLPVVPPRPQAVAQQAVAHAPRQVAAAEEEASFSVDLDETLDESEPVTLPMGAPDNPAPVRAAPVKAPALPETGVTEVHARPASLWRRLLAFTIDTGAIGGVAALYLMLASSVAGVQAPQTGLSGLDAFVIQVRALQSVLVPGAVLLLVLSLVYCAVAAFLWNGRTLGRRLLGLRLVDTHGMAPAPGRAVVRAMLASLSFGLFLAGFWMALFDRRGQTLHDKLTSTYVVQPS
ncbi:RDD family protein [Archangium violaceum]|uniref:RDD family protein n=1 Tax=Archangium violaceum TaxID=83451 RepID=UPI001EF6E9D4|nr:RDD family protein [Archangium violaceum]